MNIKLSDFKQQEYDQSLIKKTRNKLFERTNSSEIGFLDFPKNYDGYEKLEKLCSNFKDKKFFVHIGIGGSSLGPKMLLEALTLKNESSDKKYFFLDNSDPELFLDIISQINIKESLFYIVSKSGSTLETISIFSLLIQKMDSLGINSEEINKYFVFCTDPEKSELLDLSKEYKIESLEVPSNIGGRYSTLTEVGLFPTLFFNLNIKEILSGATELTEDYKNGKLPILDELAQSITNHYQNNGIDQTIIMPYASKLKPFSDWFVQLWAESLGKDGKGLTPISSYGATDHHSQVQLFLEGPKNKFPIIIGAKRSRHQTSELKCSIKSKTFNRVSDFSLNKIFQAQQFALIESFKQIESSFCNIQIESINESEVGKLIMTSMILTSLVGINIGINPYDQPGVEGVKINTWNILSK